jgi:high-affinity nickel-transport protein
MFSLGHSTIVVLGSVAIAVAALALQHRMDAVRDIGGVIGTLVSTFFLFGIAIVNLIVLRSIYGAFVRVRGGAPYVEEDFDLLLANRGFLARLFRPMFAIITRSWHMYPLGVLFGLGFDTATEIGLLGIPRLKPRRVCRYGRSWYSRRFSPQECYSSTQRTISSCLGPMAGPSLNRFANSTTT